MSKVIMNSIKEDNAQKERKMHKFVVAANRLHN